MNAYLIIGIVLASIVIGNIIIRQMATIIGLRKEKETMSLTLDDEADYSAGLKVDIRNLRYDRDYLLDGWYQERKYLLNKDVANACKMNIFEDNAKALQGNISLMQESINIKDALIAKLHEREKQLESGKLLAFINMHDMDKSGRSAVSRWLEKSGFKQMTSGVWSHEYKSINELKVIKHRIEAERSRHGFTVQFVNGVEYTAPVESGIVERNWRDFSGLKVGDEVVYNFDDGAVLVYFIRREPSFIVTRPKKDPQDTQHERLSNHDGTSCDRVVRLYHLADPSRPRYEGEA